MVVWVDPRNDLSVVEEENVVVVVVVWGVVWGVVVWVVDCRTDRQIIHPKRPRHHHRRHRRRGVVVVVDGRKRNVISLRNDSTRVENLVRRVEAVARVVVV